MTQLMQVLIILVIFSAIGADNTCDYVTDDSSRDPSSVESVIANVIAFSGDDSVVTQNIPFCLIKDNEECFPSDLEMGQGKHSHFADHIHFYFGGYKNRVPYLLYSMPDKKTRAVISTAIRSLSCKSRKCGAVTSKCEPCDPPKCTKDETINWAGFHRLRDELEAAYRSEQDKKRLEEEKKQQQARDDANYETNYLFSWRTEHLKDMNCFYVNTHRSSRYSYRRIGYGKAAYRVPRRGQLPITAPVKIEVQKGGGVFLIGICSINHGQKCFPRTTGEFKSLKKHLLSTKVLPALPKHSAHLKEEEEDSSSANQSLVLKSWNCYSGTCNPKTLTCQALKEGEQRPIRVWRLYEYNVKALGLQRSSVNLLTAFLVFVEISIFFFQLV